MLVMNYLSQICKPYDYGIIATNARLPLPSVFFGSLLPFSTLPQF